MKTFVVVYIELTWHFLDIEDSNNYYTSINYDIKDTVITFQTSDFIREIKTINKQLPTIIDLESLDRQMSQEGKDLRGYQLWKMLNRLQHHKIIDSNFKLTKENIKTFLEHIINLYEHLINKDQIETIRFNEIEIKINNIIYKTQKEGISINSEIVRTRCEELDRYIYEIKNILQIEYNIFSPDCIETQTSYLKNKKYTIIESLIYSFKIRRKSDRVCNLFYELLSNQRDLDSLMLIQSHWGTSHTYPTYLGFGTITSRITLRQPSLQNLRKSNRDIIAPNIGTQIMYIDYGQFEAGILASLSNDKKLIRLYDSDIYSDLAGHALGNREERNEAKILFYRYMYGDSSLPQNAVSYFQNFPDLEKFRQKIENEVLTNKKIGTVNGNFRRSFEDDNTWALSHKIQSTASYIYKSAVIRVDREVKAAQFLIPMHDGTVYQIKQIAYEESKNKIETIYKEEFKKVCPQINPIVKIKESFE